MTARGYHTKHSKGNPLLRGHKHDAVIAAAAAATAASAAVAAHASPSPAEVANVVAGGRVLGRYSIKILFLHNCINHNITFLCSKVI